jgi:hypothetical protein
MRAVAFPPGQEYRKPGNARSGPLSGEARNSSRVAEVVVIPCSRYS